MSETAEPRPSGRACGGCSVILGPSLLACPACGRLVHKERLETLAATAALASSEGRPDDAIGAWRDALVLLPDDSRQADVIRERIDALVRLPSTSTTRARRGLVATTAGVVGGLGLLLLKLKWVIAFFFTQGKLALLGLTKVATLLSMLASFALYWNLFGWPFAIGLVGSIYVHELGHVAALRYLGIPVDAPMFVPGFGAFVRLRQRPASPKEDASVALAGPEAGLLAALLSAALYGITGLAVFGAIARTGAWINLFNLLPVGPLDGGRALRALSRAHRIVLTVVCAAMLLLTGETMLLLVGAVLVVRLFEPDPPRSRHAHLPALARFAFVVIALSLVARLAAPPELAP
ncbi:MAG: site-2 protease family protein [Deltaproteobacteria bacterium]|nr:site-2 protease family protein [Deltaproteobacteria bacterium]